MYVERLHVRRLKLLRDFRLDFRRPDGSLRHWTVLIGKNGSAKTSVLQAIALAATGSLQLNRVGRRVIGHLKDRRQANASLSIDAVFDFTPQARQRDDVHPTIKRVPGAEERLLSQVRMAAREKVLRGAARYGLATDDLSAFGAAVARDPLDEARARNLPLWFVAGYGIHRFLREPTASGATLEQPSIERLESLFSPEVALTSLRFLDHFEKRKARKFAEILRDTFKVSDDLIPDLENVELRGSGGVTKAGQLIDKERFHMRVGGQTRKVPAVALSHGYQSTVAWIADLIGHVMLEAKADIAAEEIEGLVLLDEIDLYLHPTWQAGFVQALRTTFPKVQFVATTHSPVILAGLAPDEIVCVGQEPSSGDVVRWGHDAETGELVPYADGRAIYEQDPRTMTGSDIYRAWFDLERLTLHPRGDAVRRYTRIASNPWRDDDEDRELSAIEQDLATRGVEHLRPPVPREDGGGDP